MSKTLWSNVNHQIHVAYQRGYGKNASERKEMREEGTRTIAVKSSRNVITNDCKRFVEYCKEHHPQSRTIEQSREHIGEWVEKLQSQGIKNETIHGYLDHLGVVYGVSGGNYGLGRSAAPEKGRDYSDRDLSDRQNPRYERFLDLSKMTGLRRGELSKLSYSDFSKGRDGYYYVSVRGKGGRLQEQRINERYEEKAREYSEKRSDEKILSKQECSNHINAHLIRRELAQEMYSKYQEQCRTREGQEQLFREVKEAFERGYSRSPESTRDWREVKDIKLLEKDLNSVYKTRGAQKEALEKVGAPTVFDRLPLLAVSTFHLAHWRCDVTVHNYFK